MLINALRGHLAEFGITEFGIIAASGPGGVSAAITARHEAQDGLPDLARQVLHGLIDWMRVTSAAIVKAAKRILAWSVAGRHRASEASRRLPTLPGIGPITASAIAAAVPDAPLCRSGRQFAAGLGLTPRAHSSGGKEE